MSELTDRQKDLSRAAAMTGMDTDEIGNISPHPDGAYGDYDEDHLKPDVNQVESKLKSSDSTDVSGDN